MMGDLGAHLPTPHCVQQLLTKNSMTSMPQPPYSHLALRDFFLFPWIKKVLKGKVSADVEEVKQKKQKHKKASKSMSSTLF